MSKSVAVVIPVLWGDMDALGHVNNVRYVRWFESARIALLEAIGVATSGAGVGPILATQTCDYLRPAVYPCTVRVTAEVTRVGETSMTMAYEVKDQDRPEIAYAKGTSVVVIVDYATSQKLRVPDDVRRAIDAG